MTPERQTPPPHPGCGGWEVVVVVVVVVGDWFDSLPGGQPLRGALGGRSCLGNPVDETRGRIETLDQAFDSLKQCGVNIFLN